jgi:hypothetical protein
MKPAIITALILTAYAFWIDSLGATANWLETGLLIAVFSAGIGYFLRGEK